MKKAVFFDIDGTLWDFKRIFRKVQKSIKRAQKKWLLCISYAVEEAGQILKVPNYLHLDLTESWRHAVHISNLREKSCLTAADERTDRAYPCSAAETSDPDGLRGTELYLCG